MVSVMPIRKIDMITKENVINTVSLIKAYNDNTMNIGTCFFYKYSNNKTVNYFLISNAHVLKDCNEFEFDITCFDKNGIIKIVNNRFSEEPIIHNEYDLAYININMVIEQSNINGYDLLIQYITESDVLKNTGDFSSIENIFSVGYPNALIADNKMCPIVKHGITSTPIKRNYDNKEEFLIDIFSFNGSSGSPIFLESGDKLLLLGIQRGHLTYQEVNTGLGVCIKSNVLMNFLYQ